MKKLLSLLALVMLIGILSACSNSGRMEAKLQKPVNTETKENDQSTNVSGDTKAKTLEDLQAAFKGETTASAKYAAYSKKAEEEGYHNIALLFKAASMSENIHANNHKSVLEEYGTETPTITPEFTVMTTQENLKDAIKGESYESSTMYPEFIKDAGASKSQLALISLNYAFETEKKHKAMYENALVALDNNTVKNLPDSYYVCPTCGNTYDTAPPKRCGISMTSSEKFFKINRI